MKDQDWFKNAIRMQKDSFKNCHLGKYEMESIAREIVGNYQMVKNINLDEDTREVLVKKIWFMYLHTNS